MTVAELITELQKYPQHLDVIAMDGSNEGYGEDIDAVTEVVHDEELCNAVYIVVGKIK